MLKTRIWHKDNVHKFQEGDKVVVFRRKKNGHPKYLKDGVVYGVKGINGDDVIISSDGLYGSKIDYKIHKSYLIDIQFIRDELIDELLKGGYNF